jgi:hypothetical protein
MPKKSSFSRPQLIVFVLVFSLIGWAIYRSLAAPNPNLPGDLNNDNTVNVTDLSILLSNYGTTNTNADINNDGSVNVLDLSILLSHYGSSYVPPGNNYGASLPSPLSVSTGSVVVGSPTQSLSSLLSALSPGQTLQLHGGIYGAGLADKAYLSVSGTASAPITVKSYPGERAIIKQLIEVTGSYIRLSDLTFDKNSYPTDARLGQPIIPGGGEVGIWLNGSHITLEHSEVRNNTMSGIYHDGGDYIQILYNWVHNNGTTHDDHGMYIGAGGSSSIIGGNIVDHNATFGIQIQYGSHDWIVTNNTIVANGLSQAGSGTVQDAPATNLLWVNNISTSNGEVAYKSYTATGVLSHNLAFANPQGATYGSFGTVNNLLQADPLYTSSTDFHLQNTSPAKSYGDPAYIMPFDYDGQSRSTASLGAYR